MVKQCLYAVSFRLLCCCFVIWQGTLYSKMEPFKYVYSDKNSQNQVNDSELTKMSEDELFDSVKQILVSSYQKLVSYTALYYTGLAVNSSYEKIILELGGDVLNLVRLLALYLPAMLSNPNTTKMEKGIKCAKLVLGVVVLGLWAKECFQKFNGKNGSNARFQYGNFQQQQLAVGYNRPSYNQHMHHDYNGGMVNR